MTDASDQYLINQIIEGNTNSFAVLVDRYKNMVFSLTLKMIKNREEAEEVAQDVFVKVYNSLVKFKGESKFSTWIYKVAFNTCLDHLKKHKRSGQIFVDNEISDIQIASLENSYNELEEIERKEKIQKCLDLLPSEDSFLLTLFYFEEQSLEEIAKVINSNANNVKVKLYRSRVKLASLLRERLEPETINYYENTRR